MSFKKNVHKFSQQFLIKMNFGQPLPMPNMWPTVVPFSGRLGIIIKCVPRIGIRMKTALACSTWTKHCNIQIKHCSTQRKNSRKQTQNCGTKTKHSSTRSKQCKVLSKQTNIKYANKTLSSQKKHCSTQIKRCPNYFLMFFFKQKYEFSVVSLKDFL